MMIGLDRQMLDFLVGQQSVQCTGPLEMIHFPLDHLAAKLVAIDNLFGIEHDVTNSRSGPARDQNQQAQDGPESDHELF